MYLCFFCLVYLSFFPFFLPIGLLGTFTNEYFLNIIFLHLLHQHTILHNQLNCSNSQKPIIMSSLLWSLAHMITHLINLMPLSCPLNNNKGSNKWHSPTIAQISRTLLAFSLLFFSSYFHSSQYSIFSIILDHNRYPRLTWFQMLDY